MLYNGVADPETAIPKRSLKSHKSHYTLCHRVNNKRSNQRQRHITWSVYNMGSWFGGSIHHYNGSTVY